MSLVRVKNLAVKLQDAIPPAQEKLTMKYYSLTDRKRASRKGRDLQQDVTILNDLLEAVERFGRVIDHTNEEEE